MPLAFDEEHGPTRAFLNDTETIHLADISGDGLSDIVRIRNGELCYWPNLGYGRFGPKVSMDNAPRFDDDTSFDPQRLLLAEIDATGTTDLISHTAAESDCGSTNPETAGAQRPNYPSILASVTNLQ